MSTFTNSPLAVAVANASSLDQSGMILGEFCQWTDIPELCFLTVIPIALFCVCAVGSVAFLCFRTAVAKEYQRLGEWAESSLVPPSLKNLPRKRRTRIFAKLKTMSLQKLFKKLQLDPAFAESCAAVGIATLGDLLLLRPVFLRDLGFGLTEKQHIMRSIERRAQYIEDLHRIQEESIELQSGVPTEVDEACASNQGEHQYYLVKPSEFYLRQHAQKEDETRGSVLSVSGSGGAGGGSNGVSTNQPGGVSGGVMFHDVHSEQVSRLFWDFFRSQFAEWRHEAVTAPLISIAADNKRSARVSKQFYLRTRHRWEEAKKRLILVRISFVSTFKRISVRHAPVTILVNEQFWLTFVLRWKLQHQRHVKVREIERAKREAKERLKILEYEARLAASRNRNEAAEGGGAKMMTDKLHAAAVAPLEAVKKLETIFSPFQRILKQRIQDTVAVVQSASLQNESNNAADASAEKNRSALLGTPSEPDSEWSIISHPDRDEEDVNKTATSPNHYEKKKGSATAAGGDDDDDDDDDGGFIIIDKDDIPVGEEKDRAELFDMDPLIEGYETTDPRTQEESFSVAVQFGRFLSVEEYEASQFILDNIELVNQVTGGGAHEDDAEVLKELAAEVEYTTSVAMWNRFVHEFQEGEVGIVVPPKPMQSGHGTVNVEPAAHPRFDAPPSAEEEELKTVNAYRPPLVPSSAPTIAVTPEYVVQLHIISIINTSERFDEMRRRLLMMRGDEILDRWQDGSGTAAAGGVVPEVALVGSRDVSPVRGRPHPMMREDAGTGLWTTPIKSRETTTPARSQRGRSNTPPKIAASKMNSAARVTSVAALTSRRRADDETTERQPSPSSSL